MSAKKPKRARTEREREQHKIQMRALRAADPEKAKRVAARYREKNREKVRAGNRGQYRKNRERRLAYAKAYITGNPWVKRASALSRNKGRYNEWKRRWRRANVERDRAARARYYRAHRFAAKLTGMNRRARKLAAGGLFSKADVAFLMTKQRGRCAHFWCRVNVRKAYHIDHIIPLSAAGRNDRRNLQILCPFCNLSKGALHPIDYAQRHGLLL